MIQFPRKTLYQFGSDQPSNATTVLGSQAAGSVVYATDLVAIQTNYTGAPTAQWENGLVGPVGPLVGNGSPTSPDFNALFQESLNQTAYLLQQGMPAWDAGTTYYNGNFCAYPPNDSVTANIYLSQSANNTGNNPSTDGGTNWLPWLNVVKAPSLVKASVVFDGTGAVGPCPIYQAFNVASVTKNATGNYTVNFSSNMASVNYGFTGSCGTYPGRSFSNGDDNFMSRGFTGATPVQTVAACKVFCIQAGGIPTLEDSSNITANFN